jgi:hypothetical protein
LRGSIRQLVLFDVADEINLETLRTALAIRSPDRRPRLPQTRPRLRTLRTAPIIEPLSVDRFEARAKYYHYGVVSIELDEQFSLDWPQLVEAAASRLSDPSLEHRAMELLKNRLTKAPAALSNPYRNWLSEDYTIITVLPESGIAAPELLAQHGRQIAQIVRGETRALSEGEYLEILGATFLLPERSAGGGLVGRVRI